MNLNLEIAFLEGMPIDRADLRALRDKVYRDNKILQETLAILLSMVGTGQSDRIEVLLERLKQ
jgi:hypothetical protein